MKWWWRYFARRRLYARTLWKLTVMVGLWRLTASYNSFFAWEHAWPSPGEFTKRASLNGRIDLSQAEAVMDLIRAKTDKSMQMAMRQLDGELSKLIPEFTPRNLKHLSASGSKYRLSRIRRRGRNDLATVAREDNASLTRDSRIAKYGKAKENLAWRLEDSYRRASKRRKKNRVYWMCYCAKKKAIVTDIGDDSWHDWRIRECSWRATSTDWYGPEFVKRMTLLNESGWNEAVKR